MAKKKRNFRKIIWGIIAILVLFVLVVIVNLVLFEKNTSVVSKGEPIANYDAQNSALLVVDIQEATTGTVSAIGYYKQQSDSLISKINLLSNVFESRNSLVVFVRSEVSNPIINLINSSFAKGSLGAEFDKRLNVTRGTEIVKSRNDAFYNTNLDDLLASNKISELYMAGLDAEFCLNTTSQAAQNRNYKVTFIDEAVLSGSEAKKDSMLTEFRNRGMAVLTMENIIEGENGD